MPELDQRLLQFLQATFKEEARERIAAIGAGLQHLGRGETGAVEAVFREAHSLKAAAAAVGQAEIELSCQALESVFAALKRQELAWSDQVVDAVRGGADLLEDLLSSADQPRGPDLHARVAAQVDLLNGILAAAAQAQAPSGALGAVPRAERLPASEPTPVVRSPPGDASAALQADTLRLSLQRLDALRRNVEELIPEKQRSREIAVGLDRSLALQADWQREWSRVRTALLALADKTGQGTVAAFLRWNEVQWELMHQQLSAARKQADSAARGLMPKIDQLLGDVKEILTVQCAPQLMLLSRAARDIARTQGKQLEFTIQGGDLEADRRILDTLRDALLHLVRNSVDHGLETPAERVAAGKPPRGAVTVTAERVEGGRLAFTVADDGRGIDRGGVAAAAARSGVAPGDPDTLAEADLLALVFQSGISTSPIITDVSGRGLGLAIVREAAERLGGTVSVSSRAGHGTAFRIEVPLVMPTFRGVLVLAGGRRLVIPTLAVLKVLTVDRSAVRALENRAVVELGGAQVQVVPLDQLLEFSGPSETPPARATLVVVGKAERQVAFEVDSVEADLEILVKPLGRALARVRNVQGATVLPNGTMAPVLHVDDLLASSLAWARRSRVAPAVAPAPVRQRRILLAEDSITARGLLKHILEAAGHRVVTAVDGLDAWAALKLDAFDLLVTDVEMPRMNGFDLTARVRADSALGTLPVVLVTALASPEDRRRGVDVGANAYILKGGFERGQLLEAVERLTA